MVAWRSTPVEAWRSSPVEAWRPTPVEAWRSFPRGSLEAYSRGSLEAYFRGGLEPYPLHGWGVYCLQNLGVRRQMDLEGDLLKTFLGCFHGVNGRDGSCVRFHIRYHSDSRDGFFEADRLPMALHIDQCPYS